ncbi:MAG: molybdenum cofactor guanylyltransferase [Syntrophales bacterium LBB04]|nr:molybdenum cofactor guanylyltransferase [Syntrophales bacterium LBB04]
MAKEDVTGVILAGGKNSRMGTDKAFIEINGSPMVNRTVKTLRAIFDEIIIVTNSPLLYLDQNVKLVTDIFPDKGALGGLYTGLFYSSHPLAFVCACDMPFLNSIFIKYMIDHSAGYNIIVPDNGDGLQPLHALYRRTCMHSMRALLDQGKLKVSDLYKGQKMLTIKKETIQSFYDADKMFLNVNTYEDL